jgi:hypothetical protein
MLNWPAFFIRQAAERNREIQESLAGPEPMPGSQPPLYREVSLQEIRAFADQLVRPKHRGGHGLDGDIVPAIQAALKHWNRRVPHVAGGEVSEWVKRLRFPRWYGYLSPGQADKVADLLQNRQAIQPVSVSDRPWQQEGWCDDKGWCWWFDEKDPSWVFDSPETASAWATHSLPHLALPLPSNSTDEDGDPYPSTPPCLECGAMTPEEASTKCICAGDKDSCHGCDLWPDT